MKKLILLPLLLLWSLAFGQSYPSPTYNNLTVQGALTLTNGLPLSSLVAQAANTVVANATSSSHTPTAVAIPSCSTANSSLQYTSGTGFSCGTNFAILGANTFTAAQTIAFSGVVAFTVNDTGGANQARINFQNGGNNEWGLINASSTNQFTINRYNAGTLVDSPFVISNSTGIVSMPDGMTAAGGINTSPIGNTTPASGSFTTLSASSGLNSTAVGNTTASTGAFTTLSASGAFTPSQTAGIVGTTTNNNANAGSVGEYVTATSSSTALTSGTLTNITSIPLTAGDWDATGACNFTPNASTVMQTVSGGISTTSATLPAIPLYSQSSNGGTGLPTAFSVPQQRLPLTGSTTVFMVVNSAFTTSTLNATCTISARRRR